MKRKLNRFQSVYCDVADCSVGRLVLANYRPIQLTFFIVLKQLFKHYFSLKLERLEVESMIALNFDEV